MECTLSEVKPTQGMAGRWDARAIETFKRMTPIEVPVIGSIYSVRAAPVLVDSNTV